MGDTVQDFFSELSGKVDASKTAGMNAMFQFDITGEDGGQWNVKVADGSIEVAEGTADNPTITLSAAASDWLGLVNGEINGQTAFLTGKLKIQGDMTLAMKLESLFLSG